MNCNSYGKMKMFYGHVFQFEKDCMRKQEHYFSQNVPVINNIKYPIVIINTSILLHPSPTLV